MDQGHPAGAVGAGAEAAGRPATSGCLKQRTGTVSSLPSFGHSSLIATFLTEINSVSLKVFMMKELLMTGAPVADSSGKERLYLSFVRK